jgi:hypothetical protein
MHPQPPRRTTHTPFVYDRWGRYGRPVVLLRGLLFDRIYDALYADCQHQVSEETSS